MTDTKHADAITAERVAPTIGQDEQHVIDSETAQYAGNSAVYVDEKTNKKLLWMVNKRILVCMLGTYFCQSLDKGTLNFASVMGITTDTHLHSNQYSWLGTILYMGVLFGEYPTNLLLQKLFVAKYLAFNVFAWGCVVACSAAANNFASLMVVRFLLGMFESCVQPAFIIMTGMWYTRQEQAILTSLWYSMQGIVLMCGGLLAYGTSHYHGDLIKSWQLLFMVLGIATCVWAVFIGYWLPDSPMRAKCFDEDEKRLLIERVRANETGIQNRTWKTYQMIEALCDPIVWIFVLLQILSTLIIGGLGVFSNLIIKSFGFTTLETQLLNIPQGAVMVLAMVGGAALATKTKQTTLVMHAWTIPPIIGTAIIYSYPPNASNRIGLLIAFYCTQFILGTGCLIFSLISRNIAGQTKKSTTLTLTFVFWAAGNMAAPQVFQDSDKPRYTKAFTAHFVIYILFNFTLVVFRLILIRRNARKRAAAAAGESAEAERDTSKLDEKITHAYAFDDLTDKENPDFRYDF